MASLARGEKTKCSERARVGGCGATESGQGKPGERLCRRGEGNREEERSQEHKENSRGKKSPKVLLSSAGTTKGQVLVLFMAVLC